MWCVKFLCNLNVNVFLSCWIDSTLLAPLLLLFLFSCSTFYFLSFSVIHCALLLLTQFTLDKFLFPFMHWSLFHFALFHCFPTLFLSSPAGESWGMKQRNCVRCKSAEAKFKRLKVRAKKFLRLMASVFQMMEGEELGVLITAWPRVTVWCSCEESKFSSRAYKEKYL